MQKLAELEFQQKTRIRFVSSALMHSSPEEKLRIALQVSGKIIGVNLRQPQDAPESTDLQFSVERDNRSHFPFGSLF
ncbi:protein of unknown function [Methanoculleus bourgensis]|uniref:Uncharacterized protein n=1 Tax=Methanoculleus bourgensis TaxID=83986 RepID=A0A0X3BK91_9EURY|nr:protein of unknown function [Methanoculleus bourgensis]